MAKIHIIVGTVMGTALDVAKSAKAVLEGYGHSVTLYENFKAPDWPNDNQDILLLCTSNTGMGDLPENIMPFYHYITTEFPRCASKKYGVINLGDSSYPNFAEAGQTLDKALSDIGAIRIGDPLVIDANEGEDPEEQATEWLDTWQQRLTTHP